MGVLGNVMLRQTPWGLNAFLFVTAFVAALMMLFRRHRPELLTKTTIALGGAMVFFASMFLIRDSMQLLTFDTLAILVLMGVMLLANFDVKAHVAGTFHYGASFIWSGLTSLFGPFVLLGADIEWKAMPGNKLSRTIFSILRGFAIALPLVLIFGALFVAADAVFEGLVNRAFNFDLDQIVSHVLLTSVFAWLTAGYFRGAVATWPVAAAVNDATAAAATTVSTDSSAAKTTSSDATPVEKVVAEQTENSGGLPDNATILEHINRSDPPAVPQPETKKKRDWQNFDNSFLPSVFTLGTIETIVILGLLDLLFLSFVSIQVQYLFGGMDFVQNTPDFKLSEYARRGFGELVAVAALVLPMLLASHWLLRRDGRRTETIFRVLAGIQIGLLFVIMASAVQRLVLLTGELGYGMTTVRFYPMVFMTWLAIVFVWFLLTVFRGARNHFAWGALWSAVVILGVTNLMNPDAFIVRTNLQLMQQGREFDGSYNAHLSDDSLPLVLEALPTLDHDDQCQVKNELHWQLTQSRAETDMRSWSYPRSVARSLLELNHAAFDDHAGCPEWMSFSEE